MTHREPTTTGPDKQPYTAIAEAMLTALAFSELISKSQCCHRSIIGGMDGSESCSGCGDAC